MAKKIRRILDPVHSLVEFESDFDEHCWRVIETPVFQRLRRVKQLGFSEFVYPGATHSRFSHSIGVFETARKLARVIRQIQGEKYEEPRAQAAVAAALVHDVGHGPFSHAFEDVLRKLGLRKHEARSVELIRETEIAGIFDDFKLKLSHSAADIIKNKVPDDIYAGIVSSQFDADRLDYMRRDRFMTGTQSSAIDFDWLKANLEIRRVKIGQDEAALTEIETLVVGNKALLAAEAYILGLFHLYPAVYYHKATRSAEKIFTELLMRVFRLSLDGSVAKTGLPDGHPIVRFAAAPENLDIFLSLDDHVIWGSLPLFSDATDKCVSELAKRLSQRKLYKAIDVTARLEAEFRDLPELERDKKRREIEAKIRDRLKSSPLLESSDSAPAVLEDAVDRDPYEPGQGDGAVLKQIFGVDRSGQLKELSQLSKVVAALKKFEAYRIYVRADDGEAKEEIEKIIGDACNG